jgi:D-glycero-alpha-D-manno-heptose 1-phosphate guanylyltransferase
MIPEAIVLAGGLGTRLQSAVPDLPKCLAPVAGRSFLEYLLVCYRKQGVKRFIFALGYKTEMVESFVRETLFPSEYAFSIETDPLGTGGAVYQACRQVSGAHAIVLNADTFFGLKLSALSSAHQDRKEDCNLALKPKKQVDRYGQVELNDRQQVIGFSEKKYIESGLINGGVYALQVRNFLTKSFPAAFSFERDYLEKEYSKGNIYGVVSDAYFIDIGVPEDYRQAQKELIQHIDDGV